MENFSFCNPTQIEFGRDKEKNIGKYISQNGVKKVLLVYGSKRVIEDGLFDVVINSLKENGVDFIAFGGVVSNPILGTIQNAIKIAKDEKVESNCRASSRSSLVNRPRLLSYARSIAVNCATGTSIVAPSRQTSTDKPIGMMPR